jgi:hypothetical protein
VLAERLDNAPVSDEVNLQDREAVKALLGSREWRMNHLYRIKDKTAHEVTFVLNEVQQQLEAELHNRNIVLKSRQHGVTTWACIRALDTALFRHGVVCGLVFHKKEEATKAFVHKVMYAYDRLPGWLRADIPVVKRDATGEVEFSNGSRIEVSTSHRGGTLQFLHISEYGPMVAMYPARAEEVSSGALNTLAPDTIVTIESTAMGAWGDFYDRCGTAMSHDKQVEAGEAVRTQLDYKLHFFGWWQDPSNRIDPEGVRIPERGPGSHAYFDALEARFECRIFPAQRAWYVKKLIEQKSKMKREHPSDAKEAFEGSIEGAYYGEEIAQIEGDGRILVLPFNPTLPVFSFWDIGRSDATAIWLMQPDGPWLNFIRYYENNHQSSAHYTGLLAKWRDELKYRYAKHYLPHDAGNTDWSQNENKTRKQVVEDAGIGPVEVVPRIENLADGIEMTRQMLSRCRFDSLLCGEHPIGSGRGGLPALRAYRKTFDEKAQVWNDVPAKSWARHGADAIRQCAQGYINPKAGDPDKKKRHRTAARERSAMTA